MTVSASLTQLVQEDLEEEAASLTSKVSTTVWTVLLKMLTFLVDALAHHIQQAAVVLQQRLSAALY